jgi:hypothetical protein
LCGSCRGASAEKHSTHRSCAGECDDVGGNVLSRSDSRLSPASQREIAGKATISAPPPERSIVKTRFRHISAYLCRGCDIPALETRPAVGVGPGDLSKVDRTFTRHSRWRHDNMRPAVKVVRRGAWPVRVDAQCCCAVAHGKRCKSMHVAERRLGPVFLHPEVDGLKAIRDAQSGNLIRSLVQPK